MYKVVGKYRGQRYIVVVDLTGKLRAVPEEDFQPRLNVPTSIPAHLLSGFWENAEVAYLLAGQAGVNFKLTECAVEVVHI
jgi:hypothetical protein